MPVGTMYFEILKPHYDYSAVFNFITDGWITL